MHAAARVSLVPRLEIAVNRPDDIRARALDELSRFGVLMLDGHFDYGNGYHGRTYLNPHQLFRYPSTIWRLAQDLLDLVPVGGDDGHRGRRRPGHGRRAARAHDRRAARQPPQPHAPAVLVCAVRDGRATTARGSAASTGSS